MADNFRRNRERQFLARSAFEASTNAQYRYFEMRQQPATEPAGENTPAVIGNNTPQVIENNTPKLVDHNTPQVIDKWCTEDELRSFFSTTPTRDDGKGASGGGARLQIVNITFGDHNGSIGAYDAPSRLFLDLFAACRLDPCMLLSLGSLGRRFEQYRTTAATTPPAALASSSSSSRRSSSLPLPIVDSFLLWTALVNTIWSHDPTTATTRAIMLNWRGWDSRRRYFDRVTSFAASHGSLLSGADDGLIRLAVLLGIDARVADECGTAFHELRKAERVTGYGEQVVDDDDSLQDGQRPGRQLTSSVLAAAAKDRCEDPAARTAQLTEVSRKVGYVAVALAYLGEEIETAVELARSPLSSSLPPSDEIAVVGAYIGNQKSNLALLNKRIRVISNAVFNLINQIDSRSSQQMAAAARREAESMRTLALMTTVFLPATFFATLFSVPTLHWSDPENVVGERFWVYLVFTLPVTAVMLAVYMGWNARRSWVVPKVDKVVAGVRGAGVSAAGWVRGRVEKMKRHVLGSADRPVVLDEEMMVGVQDDDGARRGTVVSDSPEGCSSSDGPEKKKD